MLYFLLSFEVVAAPLATKPINSYSFKEIINSTAEEIVGAYVDHHPAVMASYQEFLEQLSSLKREGKIGEKEIDRILQALIFAAEKHRGQTRKDKEQTPYIIHPIGVSYTLATLGEVYDADVLIAALLHDTVEDTNTSFEEIRSLFGAVVEGYVREVTDDKVLPKEVRKQLQIEHAHHKSLGAALIKLSDKLYNLRDLSKNPPPDWSKERIDQYFLWAEQVISNLPEVNLQLKQAIDEMISSHFMKDKGNI